MLEFFMFISLMTATLLYVFVEWVYPSVITRKIKKTDRHTAEFFAEYRTSLVGYLGTIWPLLWSGIFLYGALGIMSTEKREGWQYFLLVAGLIILVLWFSFKLLYILPRRCFKWENNTIYYHTGLREITIDEIKHIHGYNTARTNYFHLKTERTDKPGVYWHIDILSLMHPEKIYSILKVKSKSLYEFYY